MYSKGVEASFANACMAYQFVHHKYQKIILRVLSRAPVASPNICPEGVTCRTRGLGIMGLAYYQVRSRVALYIFASICIVLCIRESWPCVTRVANGKQRKDSQQTLNSFVNLGLASTTITPPKWPILKLYCSRMPSVRRSTDVLLFLQIVKCTSSILSISSNAIRDRSLAAVL